jgi:hypothetical protein
LNFDDKAVERTEERRKGGSAEALDRDETVSGTSPERAPKINSVCVELIGERLSLPAE